LRTVSKLLSTFLTACVVVAVLSAVNTSAHAATSAPVSDQVRAAAAYGTEHGLRTAVSVLDLRTGAYYGAGADDRLFGTASVVKVMIAARLLATGQMYGSTASLAYDMIVRSNDDAASALWPRVGGPGLINWVKARYRIPFLGTPNIRPGHWGNTHVTARGLVYLYRAIKADPRVGPWVLRAMHHYSCTAWDGTNQCFGIPSAASGAGVKQGWASHSADSYADAIVNSTGYLNGDRYAVAILSEGRENNDSTNWTGYNAAEARIVTAQARLLIPAGLIDTPRRHNPTVQLTSVTAIGNTITVSGWAYDPDRRAARSAVSVSAGPNSAGHGTTDRYLPAVNQRYGLSGDHGFALHLVARDGQRTVCVTVPDAGEGTANARACRALAVDGTARGGLLSATVVGGAPVLTGWTADPDSGMRSTSVQLREDGRVLGTFRADRYSSVVNRAQHLTGAHEYVVTLPAGSDGTHSYCAYAVNTGPTVSPAYVASGCRSLTLANRPIGKAEAVDTGAGAVAVTGWAYDPNAPSSSSAVRIAVDGSSQDIVADVARPDVDAMQHITGNHGFTTSVPVAPGQHVVTVTLLNTGPGTAVSLGSWTVTVAG
jgi:hypothetical protein